jgi:hypothetical protein
VTPKSHKSPWVEEAIEGRGSTLEAAEEEDLVEGVVEEEPDGGPGFQLQQEFHAVVEEPIDIARPPRTNAQMTEVGILDTQNSPDSERIELEDIEEPIEELPSMPEYDGSILDSYLAQNAQTRDHHLTLHEILTSQNFGAVDPRIVWPKRLSSEEYKEKQKEIAARGTRKQNFGKLLTLQVRKERAEKGWGIHQTCAWGDDEESQEAIGHLEELFGITKMDKFVPAMRNHRLVMAEEEEPEVIQTGPGRRRKKPVQRIFPIMGAP